MIPKNFVIVLKYKDKELVLKINFEAVFLFICALFLIFYFNK